MGPPPDVARLETREEALADLGCELDHGVTLRLRNEADTSERDRYVDASE